MRLFANRHQIIMANLQTKILINLFALRLYVGEQSQLLPHQFRPVSIKKIDWVIAIFVLFKLIWLWQSYWIGRPLRRTRTQTNKQTQHYRPPVPLRLNKVKLWSVNKQGCSCLVSPPEGARVRRGAPGLRLPPCRGGVTSLRRWQLPADGRVSFRADDELSEGYQSKSGRHAAGTTAGVNFILFFGGERMSQSEPGEFCALFAVNVEEQVVFVPGLCLVLKVPTCQCRHGGLRSKSASIKRIYNKLWLYAH